MTNKNSTFETWFRELERLAKKLGCFIPPQRGGLKDVWKALWMPKYNRGLSPNEALEKEME